MNISVFLNGIRFSPALLIGLAIVLCGASANAKTLFEWNAGPLPRSVSSESPPKVVEDEQLGREVLVFSREDGNYFDIPYPEVSQQMTFMAMVQPSFALSRINAEIFSGATDTRGDGISFRLSWLIPIFRMGTGTEMVSVSTRGVENANLDPGFWQHVAFVFDRGTIRYYRDGELVVEQQTEVEEIRRQIDGPMTIGAYQQQRRREIYGFDGSMTGLLIADEALDRDAIAAHRKQFVEKP